jgi:heme-degrading monooxygenase HmoA
MEVIMSNAVFFNSYKLKKGTSVPDFLIAAEKLTNEHISKQKGFISSTFLVDGEVWADYTIFETMDDLNAFLESSRAAQASDTNDLAEKFYSFLNFNSCRSHVFSAERSFLPNK